MPEASGPGLIEVARVVGALLLVAGLAAAFGLLARRGMRAGATQRLHVEERLVLTRGAQLVVVRDDERRLLVEVSDKGINLVSDLGETSLATRAKSKTRSAEEQLHPGIAARLASAVAERLATRSSEA